MKNSPWTLQDARRFMKGRLYQVREGYLDMCSWGVAPSEYYFKRDSAYGVVWRAVKAVDKKKIKKSKGGYHIDGRLIDFLISRLGPKWPVVREEGEERKKNTDKIDGSSQTGQDTHGGDSCSGETESTAMTYSDSSKNTGNSDNQGGTGNPPKDQSNNKKSKKEEEKPANQQSSGTDEAYGAETDSEKEGDQDKVSSGKTSNHMSGEKEDAKPLEHDEGASCEEEHTEGDSEKLSYTDQPGCDNRVQATSEDKDSDPHKADLSHDSRDACSTESCPHWGGINAKLDRVEKAIDFVDTKDNRDIVRAIKRIFNKWDIDGIEPSPRLSAKKLTKEIVSKRHQITRAKKEELGQKYVLLLCDVSGSCSASAPETLKACVSVRRLWPEKVGVIVHSNGVIFEWELPGAIAAKLKSKAGRDATLHEIVALKDLIGGAIAFGDSDALYCYKELLKAGTKLIWLDSYGARVKGLIRHETSIPHLEYWTGINNGTRAAIALRQLQKIKQ